MLRLRFFILVVALHLLGGVIIIGGATRAITARA
jgi:hypothetical protein